MTSPIWLLTALSNVAFGQSTVSCVSGDAPVVHSCGGKCSTVPVGSNKWTYCPDIEGSVFAVEDYRGTGDRTYSMWGTDAGTDFCCFVDDESTLAVVQLDLHGDSTSDDLLSFFYGLSFVLNINRRAFGGGGNDVIYGSTDTTSSFADYLSGGGGDDDVYGFAGTNFIHGDGGIDYLYGGDDYDLIFGEGGADVIDAAGDDDVCYGGDGDDFIEGGSGADNVFGEDGDDVIRGQDGDDDLYGGVGADVLCGGDGSNYLHAVSPGFVESSNDLDWLWVPSSAATPTGGGSQPGDECGHQSHTGTWAGASCDYSNISRPADCY